MIFKKKEEPEPKESNITPVKTVKEFKEIFWNFKTAEVHKKGNLVYVTGSSKDSIYFNHYSRMPLTLEEYNNLKTLFRSILQEDI